MKIRKYYACIFVEILFIYNIISFEHVTAAPSDFHPFIFLFFRFAGTIETVDPHMNVSIIDATRYSTSDFETYFDSFFVLGKYIRYVQIPDEVHVEAAIYDRLRRTNVGMNHYKRTPKRTRA